MAEVKKDISYIKGEVSELKSTMKEFVSCADKKYASKFRVSILEKVVYATVGIVLTTVVYAILEGVFK